MFSTKPRGVPGKWAAKPGYNWRCATHARPTCPRNYGETAHLGRVPKTCVTCDGPISYTRKFAYICVDSLKDNPDVARHVNVDGRVHSRYSTDKEAGRAYVALGAAGHDRYVISYVTISTPRRR